jgi:hypothetical protein
MHGGINGGRICWSVLHTRCFGSVQSNYASKMKTCLDCPFYKLVKSEEGSALLSPSEVLRKLNPVE